MDSTTTPNSELFSQSTLSIQSNIKLKDKYSLFLFFIRNSCMNFASSAYRNKSPRRGAQLVPIRMLIILLKTNATCNNYGVNQEIKLLDNIIFREFFFNQSSLLKSMIWTSLKRRYLYLHLKFLFLKHSKPILSLCFLSFEWRILM